MQAILAMAMQPPSTQLFADMAGATGSAGAAVTARRPASTPSTQWAVRTCMCPCAAGQTGAPLSACPKAVAGLGCSNMQVQNPYSLDSEQRALGDPEVGILVLPAYTIATQGIRIFACTKSLHCPPRGGRGLIAPQAT
eukprot:357698-Chlamydomonas_euryale.AAC.1